MAAAADKPWRYCGVVTDLDCLTLLSEAVDKEQKVVRVFDKEFLEPRLTRLYSTVAGHRFTYSGLTMAAALWDTAPDATDPLSRTLTHLAAIARQHYPDGVPNEAYDTALLNVYRSGQDCIHAHSDKDGAAHVIASYSFGAQRPFKIHEKHGKSTRVVETIQTEHGSLLLMLPGMQAAYKHSLPRHANTGDAVRVNVTFRTQRLDPKPDRKRKRMPAATDDAENKRTKPDG